MKQSVALCAFTAASFAAHPSLAVNKNQSAEFVRTLNRNASTDVDATFFNPAGLAFLPGDGLYFSLSNQFIFIDKTIQDKSNFLSTIHPAEYEAHTRALVYPVVHVSYHFLEDLAAYFNFMPIGGGGGGEYKDGLPSFDAALASAINARLEPLGAEITSFNRDLHFNGSSYNLSWSVGAAYKFSDVVSAALGYRLTYALRSYAGRVRGIQIETNNEDITPLANDTIRTTVGDNEFEVKANGFGHTFIGGVHVRPTRGLDIGIRAEYSTLLEIENETTTKGPSDAIKNLIAQTSYGDGKKTRITEPLLVSLGVSYLFFDALKLEADVTYTFGRLLDLGGEEKKQRNKPFAGAAVEYAFLPALKASVGYAYDLGATLPEGRNEIDFGTAAHYFSGGLSYTVLPDLDVTGGVVYSFRPAAEATTSTAPGGGNQVLSETSVDIGIGLSYRLAAKDAAGR